MAVGTMGPRRITIPKQARDALAEQKRQRDQAQKDKIAKDREMKYDDLRMRRNRDIETGRERGRGIFQNQLGRVREDRSAAMGDIINTRKQQAEQGLGAQQFQAAREARLQGLNRGQQMQQRQLQQQQARMGLRGGAAGGQLARLMAEQGRVRGDAERQLLLDDVALRQNLMDKYQGALGGVEADELQRQQFNLAQLGKEKFGELSTGLAEAQLGVTERGGVRTEEIGRLMAEATRNSGGGGGKK